MKTIRFRILVAVLALCSLLTSCMQQPVETQPPETQPPTALTTELATEPSSDPKIRKLHVAYMETDLASLQIVESFVSEDIELVPVILSEEAFDNYLLYTENPADIILIPHTTEVNTAAYALQKHVYKLDEMIPKILEKTEYYPILDAGKIDGFQYFLPLRFQLPYLLTTESNLDIFALSSFERNDMKTRMMQIQDLIENKEAGKGLILTPIESDIGAALYYALRLSGVWKADPASPGAPITEELLYEYGQYIYALWKETKYTQKQQQRTHAAYPYPLISSEKFPLVLGEGCLPDVFRVFDSRNSNHPILLGHPQYSTANSLTADITLYAAIQTSGDNVAHIQEFLHHAFTTPEGQGMQEGLSACRAAVATYMDRLANQPAQVFADGPCYQTVQNLSKSVRGACEAILNQITSGSIRNAYWDRLFSNKMDGFLLGEKSYEECLQSLSDRLDCYSEDTVVSTEEDLLPKTLMEEIDLEQANSFYADKYPLFPHSWYGSNQNNAHEIKALCGHFRNCIVFLHMRVGIFGDVISQKVGDIRLEYNGDYDLYAYRNGVFFELSDAYNRGYLSLKDVEHVKRCLDDYMKMESN